ncbi:MAG TPA: hypothetical protein VF420_07655 [Casimicrobiaceae bacterium]
MKPPCSSFSCVASYTFEGSGDWNQQSQLGQAQYGLSRKRALTGALQIGQAGIRERLSNPRPRLATAPLRRTDTRKAPASARSEQTLALELRVYYGPADTAHHLVPSKMNQNELYVFVDVRLGASSVIEPVAPAIPTGVTMQWSELPLRLFTCFTTTMRPVLIDTVGSVTVTVPLPVALQRITKSVLGSIV